MEPHPLFDFAEKIHQAFAQEPNRSWLRERLRESAIACETAKVASDEADQVLKIALESQRQQARKYFEVVIHRKGREYLLDRDAKPPTNDTLQNDPSVDDRLKDHRLFPYRRALGEHEKVPERLKRFVRTRPPEKVVRNLTLASEEKAETTGLQWTTVYALRDGGSDQCPLILELRILAWTPTQLADSLATRHSREVLPSDEFHAPLPPKRIGREYAIPEICFALAVIHDGYMFAEPAIVPRDSELFGLLGHRFALAIAKYRSEGLGDSVSEWGGSDLKKLAELLGRVISVSKESKPLTRDEWLYQQAEQGVPWKAICTALNAEAPSHDGWDTLEGGDGVRQAVKRYIKKSGKPPLPPRKRGSVPETNMT